MDLCELDDNLAHKVNSRTAKATQRDPASLKRGGECNSVTGNRMELGIVTLN